MPRLKFGVSIIFGGMVTNAFTIYQKQLQDVYKLLRITPMRFTKFSKGTSAWIVVSTVLTLLFDFN